VNVINASITPKKTLKVLSRSEVNRLKSVSDNGLYELFKRCAFAVLNCGNTSDDVFSSQQAYKAFDVDILQMDRGILLKLKNAPASAFVDGEIIYGIREHLFTVLRDILYINEEITARPRFDMDTSEGITNAVFHILRNAQILAPTTDPNLIICWGGHSIGRVEYDYTKEVGYQLGLRGLDIGTGCGPGAMKGPMKGATIAHAKQHRKEGRYVGLTEPGIIAAEAPNPIVNELVILPDIEKRLEAFVRVTHGIIVFPGGAGTAEEILYLLGILLHPDNQEIPFPVVFTGPKESEEYFLQIHHFIGVTLGEAAQKRYTMIMDNPPEVARHMRKSTQEVRDYRKQTNDAFFFNWALTIEPSFQTPFEPSHENMAKLDLRADQPAHILAANLRRAFSGIVAGNVKEDGILAVREKGPYEISGDKAILEPLSALLQSMVDQHRMKLPGAAYEACFRLKL
jgi:predicted Rossmann-fold nucleotide-binding protein